MIINNIALLVNDFINSLYRNNIPFYIIIIGLFIFSFIEYLLIKFIRDNNTIKY